MSSRPEVLHAVRVWVEKAEEDLRVAQRLLGLGEGFYSAITFHAQQASEKYIKALLTLQGVGFPRTHDLVETLLLVPRELQLGVAVSEVAP